MGSPLTPRSTKLIAVFLALCLLSAGLLAYRFLRRPAVDPLAILPPGAGLLAGADIQHLRRNFLWLSLADFLLPGALPRDDAYDRFVAETGFAFERDVDRITLALLPASPRPALVALVTGRFPRESLVRYALAHGGRRAERAGVEIYRVPLDQSRELWFAPLNEKNFLVANGSALEAATDRARSRLRLPQDSNPLFTTAASLARGDEVWLVADPKLWPDPSPVPRELARSIDLAWFEGKISSLSVELKLTALCRSELEASLAEANLRGLQLAFEASLAQERPRDQMLEKIAREIRIYREATRVDVSTALDLSTLGQWLASTRKKKEPAHKR